MPRISMWRDHRGADYKFIDRRISEMFTIGGTGILVHKYLGSEGGDGTDATKPANTTPSIQNIQDLLFLENRDRKYSDDIYTMRGIYQRQDQDFSLAQFGLFLAEGTLFMTFHLNDCLEILGRKLIPGDVIELQHLTDYWALDDSVPVALKRFYVISDCSFASEGFSPTWYPHLWRCKIQPLVDSQEYKDILSKIKAVSGNDPFVDSANASPITDYISTYGKYKEINEAIILQAETEVPKSGYDTSKFYVVPTRDDNSPGGKGSKTSAPVTVGGSRTMELTVTRTSINSDELFVGNANLAVYGATITSDLLTITDGARIIGRPSADSILLSIKTTVNTGDILTMTIPALGSGSSGSGTPANIPSASSGKLTPKGKTKGYNVGDGTGPNGMPVTSGVAFPANAKSGDYYLRLDFVPNRLFRFNGKIWIKVEDVTRTNLTPGAADNLAFRSQWFKEESYVDVNGNTQSSFSSLSNALKPKADN